MAFGVLVLFCSAMVDPIWFAARTQGLARSGASLVAFRRGDQLFLVRAISERTAFQKACGQWPLLSVSKNIYVGRSAQCQNANM